MKAYQEQFIQFMLQKKVLVFGDFTLKSGVKSPYFFNFGCFDDGHSLKEIADFYVQVMLLHEIRCDVLYGPAYKGIPIASNIAQQYYRLTGHSMGFAYQRKESKKHGEGGDFVGTPVANKTVLVIDDVISQGTAIKESFLAIDEAGGYITGALVALDRLDAYQDTGGDGRPTSAILSEKVSRPILSGIDMHDVLTYVHNHPDLLSDEQLKRIQAYRTQLKDAV